MYNSFDELKVACEQCNKCKLSETRTNLVFGVGNPHADILFIGEGPGENEDLQGQPFVGRSGRLLDKMLAEIGLSRDENIYIANIVKCRPPQNRDPSPAEQSVCIEWLNEQIKFIQPKIVVCLGRIASQVFIDKKFSVTKEHGRFIEREGYYLMGTFHPAALLRNPNNKPLAEADFQKIKEKLNEI